MGTEHFKEQKARWGAVSRRTGWLVTLASVLALAFGVGWSVSQRHQAAAALQSRILAANARTNPLPASKVVLPVVVQAERFRRVVYPYSVIPGGIHSIEELKNAIAKDPVVSAQYAAFLLANMRIIRLDRDRTMHVTYRRGDKIYWTQRELNLAKGETLITDGTRTALARCGNLIAEVTEAPVSPNEPTPQEMSTPFPNPYTPGELESDDRFPEIQFVGDPYVPPIATGLHPGGGPAPSVYVPSGPPGPIPYPGGNTPSPVVKTPEPDTAILLLAGLLVLLAAQKRMTKHAPKNVP